jgi:hypothetical protein
MGWLARSSRGRQKLHLSGPEHVEFTGSDSDRADQVKAIVPRPVVMVIVIGLRVGVGPGRSHDGRFTPHLRNALLVTTVAILSR